MKEIEFYDTIIQELESTLYSCRVYRHGKNNNGFEPIGHKKHFDLLIFNEKNNHIPNPLALEVKINHNNEGGFGDITKGLYDQVTGVYRTLLFKCPKENWEGIPKYAFTTISAFQGKSIYEKHYPKASTFFIERFSWRMGVSVLRKINGKLYLTNNGRAHCFDGTWIDWKEFDELWRIEEQQRQPQ